MKLSRRAFLTGTSALALVMSPRKSAEAADRGSVRSGFNGGKSQINMNFVGALSGEYPFMNLMKSCNISANPALTPDVCDSNGWPTKSGATYAVAMPSQNERPGNYDLSWTGTGVAGFIVNGGVRLVSGSLTPSGGAGHAVVIPNNPTVGTSANGFTIAFNGPAQNVQFCHVDDLAALALNSNEFHPQFMSVLRALNPGVIRFLNWIDGGGSPITTWATRNSPTYFSYSGTPLVASVYGGHSKANGSDLSVSTPPGGFTLADKAQLQYFLSATPPQGKTGAFTYGQANITMTAHGLAAGNQVYLRGASIPANFTGSNSDIPNPRTYFVSSVVDANTFQLSAAKGSIAIAAGSSGTCTVNPFLTISVGGGPAIPIFTKFFYPYPQGYINYPTGGTASACRNMIYDATFGAFCDIGSTLGSYSVPPEVCLDLCYKLGAHPWFCVPMMACDPATDFLTQLGSLIQTKYQNGKAPWMVPRFETPNEMWNSFGALDTQYGFRKADYYGWRGNPGSMFNWVGKVASICGQQLANVFGGANLGTKYHWIVGVQTQVLPASNSNDRVASTNFLTNDPNPVQPPYKRYAAAGGGGGSPQNWVSHICVANYFSPLRRFQCQELIDAYAYSVTNADNPTAQAALANSYVDTLVSQQATVMVTGGSANIAWTSHGLSANNKVVFMTTPPTGFTLGLTYFVKTVIDANTITLASSAGGTLITPTGSGTPVLALSSPFNLANNFTVFTQWKAWAATFGVQGLTAYEGGYSPDYLNGNWSTGITGATQANPCVLTLASTSGNSERSGLAGNPAIAGMMVVPSGVAGMTELNLSTSGTPVTFSGSKVNWTNSLSPGQAVYFRGGVLPSNIKAFIPYYVLAGGTASGFSIAPRPDGVAIAFTGSPSGVQGFVCFVVMAVSGNQVTLNVDSSAFAAYTSRGTLTYVNSGAYSNALRGAGKAAKNLQTYLTQNYDDFIRAGGTFPSCFQLGDIPPAPSNDIWSILNDVYQPFSQSAQARAIQAYNSH